MHMTAPLLVIYPISTSYPTIRCGPLSFLLSVVCATSSLLRMPVDTHHYNDILNSAIITISGDAFHADLPNIDKDTWSAILYPKGAKDKDENQRLEFLGDAVMYLCIGLELYERYPDATPHFLTVRRINSLSNFIEIRF